MIADARALDLLPSLSEGLEDAELEAEVYDVRYVFDMKDFVVGSALAGAERSSVDRVEGAKCSCGVHCNCVLIVLLSPLVDEDVEAVLQFFMWDAVEKSYQVIVDHVEMNGGGGGVHVVVQSLP